MTYTYIALFLYLTAMILVGLYFRKKSAKSLDHFFLGNRSLNFIHVALSAVVSGRSAWLILGVTGLAFVKGVSALWVFPGYTIMEFLLCWRLGPKLHERAEKNGDITLIDYFVSQLGDKWHLIRILSALAVFIFYVGYISAQLGAGEKTFQVLFHFDNKLYGMLLTAIIVGLYTTMGGFFAVAVSDLIQGILMLIGLVVLPIAAMAQFGGYDLIMAELATVNLATAGTFLSLGSLMAIVSGLAIGFGSPGNPHIIVRYMAIGDRKKLFHAATVSLITNILLGTGAVCIGVIGKAIYGGVGALPLGDKETLFLKLTLDTFNPFLAGIILAALLAAVMSTVDSQILVVSSTVARDFLQQIFWKNKDKTHDHMVKVSKIGVIVVIVIAFGLYFLVTTLPGLKTIYGYVLLAWAGLGATFGPILLLTTYWKGMTKYGAIACLLVGPVLTILFKILRTIHPEWNIPYEALPAFAGSFFVAIIVSLATRGIKIKQNVKEAESA